MQRGLFVGLLAVAQRGAAESLRRARDQLSRTVRELETSNEALRVENTERNRVEQALRENEQRFRDFADTASDWLWETGPDHRFIAFSERLGTLGVARAQALGRRRWDLASDVAEDPEKWRAHIAAHEAHQPFRGFVYRIIRPDGATVSVEISGKPFSTAMAASSVIAAPAATSRPGSEVSRPRKRFDRHRPSSLMSAG